MHSYYEINVSKLLDNGNYRHYFATSPRSLRCREEAYAALADFKARFPEDKGFNVTMTHWDAVGRTCA